MITFPERLLRRLALAVALVSGSVAFGQSSVGRAQGTPATSAGQPLVAVVEVLVVDPSTTITTTTLPVVSVVPVAPVAPVAPVVPVVPIVPGPIQAASTVAPAATAPTVPSQPALSTVPITPNSLASDPNASTTVDPGASTTIDPNATTTVDPNGTSTTLPVIGDLVDDDALSEAPPRIATPVLPPPKVPPRNRSLEEALKQLTERQRTLVEISQKRADLATVKVQEATAAIAALDEKEANLRSDVAELQSRSAGTRAKLRARALAIFAGDDIKQVDWVLDADNANSLTRNLELVNQSQTRDRELLAVFEAENVALEASQAALVSIREERQIELETVLAEQSALTDALQKMQAELASISSGAAIALGGFYFPVTAPFNFVDTYGAPRMTGTKYEHFHEGTDVFGAYGSPVIAVARGVIVRQGVAVLGGNKLWLKGTDGTEYYYAHLSAFVEGVIDGSIVEAGDTIGFLGDSGNARGTPPHVHFEVHPGGGGPVNPYPFLDAVRKSDSTALLKASIAATATTLPANIPGQIRAGIGFVRELAIGVDSEAAGPTTTQPPGSAARSTTLVVRSLSP